MVSHALFALDIKSHVNCIYYPFCMNLAGNGVDIDEYVRRAYKFAYSDCIEVGPVACLSEPPDPNELYPQQSRRQVLLLIVCIYIIVSCSGDFLCQCFHSGSY